MLYRINGKEVEKISKTKFQQQEKLEKDLENWIENDPSILGERLLLIGRQVQIPEVKDQIDLLALDINGNLVIIELKKGSIRHPVEFQSLRYASYVSRWEYDDLENQAKNYLLNKKDEEKKDEEFNFNDIFEEFCSDAGIEEIPDLNQDQRIIIVGSNLKEKIGSVALWLREHYIDIKIIEVSLFKDNQSLYLTPQVIIPIPTTEKFEIGKHASKKDKPWLINGEEWHLQKRCGKEIREKLNQLNNIIKTNFGTLEGPNWNQKFYVSFKEGNHVWTYIHTQKSTLKISIYVKKGSIKVNEVIATLGIVLFDTNKGLSEKINLKSSVEEISEYGDYDRVRIRIKDEFNVLSDEFRDFLTKCYQEFKKV